MFSGSGRKVSCCFFLKRQLCVAGHGVQAAHASGAAEQSIPVGQADQPGRGPGSGSLRDRKGDGGTGPRCSMSAGCTLPPSVMLGLGLEQIPWYLWAVSRGLCLVFPSFLPPAEQQLPRAPSGCGKSGLSLALLFPMLPPSLAPARPSAPTLPEMVSASS